jgi:hypothetical protein
MREKKQAKSQEAIRPKQKLEEEPVTKSKRTIAIQEFPTMKPGKPQMALKMSLKPFISPLSPPTF